MSEEDVGVSASTPFAALGLGAVVLQFTKLLPQRALTSSSGLEPENTFHELCDSVVSGPGAIL